MCRSITSPLSSDVGDRRRQFIGGTDHVLMPEYPARLDVGSGTFKAAQNNTLLPFGKIELQPTPNRREKTPRPPAAQMCSWRPPTRMTCTKNYSDASYGRCDGKHPRMERVTENTKAPAPIGCRPLFIYFA